MRRRTISYPADPGAIPGSSTNENTRLVSGIFVGACLKNNHLRVVVVFLWSFSDDVYFWFLHNFFTQELPL